MNIKVKFFASLRDRLGKDDEDISAEGVLTCADVWKQVAGEDVPSSILIAVNMEYTDGTHELKDGDEVAFFPPVTGG